ncbi:MAG: cohesin domain-containing protein, partial [Chloroflexota bacterium]
SEEVTLGAVYPVHPKGVAVHQGFNKVYVAFQGPVVLPEVAAAAAESPKPYPFVAVIDGETDQVLRTIPGGPDGIGRSPWGVAVSGDYVYVGSFGEGRVSVIDAISDTVIANIDPPRDDFKPTSPAVNPLTGWVHFPDYQGGRVVIINGTDIEAEPLIANQFGFSPFELVVANTLQGYNFVTMRDAIVENSTDPTPFKLRGFNTTASGFDDLALILPSGPAPRPSGSPHAIGLWQEEGVSEPRFFVTYAADTRTSPTPPDFINPNRLLVYSFPVVDPKNILLHNADIEVGDYAEVGLVYNPDAGHMLGTYAGFAYVDDNGDEAACDNPARGGNYAVNFDGGVLSGDAPGIWKQPSIVVGNPPLAGDNLQWKNPFELAINPNTGKVYVTDRCWNEFPEGGQPGGGAVLVFTDSAAGPEPGPGSLVLKFDGPAAVERTETFSVEVVAQAVPDPGLYGVQFEVNFDPTLISASNLQVNPDLVFVVKDEVDNVAGKITLVASRQGEVPGLTGDVILLTFDATAADATGDATFSFQNEKIGDSTATAFDVITETYTVTIDGVGPEPTTEPTAEPTTEPT